MQADRTDISSQPSVQRKWCSSCSNSGGRLNLYGNRKENIRKEIRREEGSREEVRCQAIGNENNIRKDIICKKINGKEDFRKEDFREQGDGRKVSTKILLLQILCEDVLRKEVRSQKGQRTQVQPACE